MKLEISCKKKTGKKTDTWRLNNMLLLNNKSDKVKNTQKLTKTVQDLWDTTNAVFREKFTAIQACLKKKGRSQISNLTLKVKELEKPNVSRCRDIIRIRAETNEIEIKKAIEKINETNRWFFEEIKLTDLQPDSSRKGEDSSK